LVNKEIGALATEDLQDIFNIIHIANCQLSLSEMRVIITRCLKRAFKADGVAFFLSNREFKSIDNANMVSVGVDPRYLDKWGRYYCHLDPFQQEARSRDTVCKVDDILPYRRWVNLPIYKEFYRPQNIHYKLSIYLRTNDRALGLIAMFRSKDNQDFSNGEMAKARIIEPHVTTALANIIRFSGIHEGGNLFREETWSAKYQLTKREIDIIMCVCQGFTNNEIGEKLYISRFTVETHLKNIFNKTGVKHRAGLASLLQ